MLLRRHNKRSVCECGLRNHLIFFLSFMKGKDEPDYVDIRIS